MEQCNKITTVGDKLDKITQRDVSKIVFDSKALQQIADKMPEIDRAMTAFGRRNTQATGTLMSLTMLNGQGSPYRLLKQCMAEISKRRSALREAMYKLRVKNVKLKKLQLKLKTEKDELELELLILKENKYSSEISETSLYIEGALKDIATQQDNYQQIRKNNNIREDWDEADFEAAEPLFHTRRAFELLYSDIITNGRMGKGTHEYLGQFGIHQQVALKEVQDYVFMVENTLAIHPLFSSAFSKKQLHGGHLEKFLDEMAAKYADSHKDVLERMGIDNMVTEFCQYKTIGNNS